MSLTPAQLAGQLKRGLAGAYLLAGEEPLLLEEAADALRVRARAEGFSEREILQVEAGFDWYRLRAAGENLSLFASRRLVEVRLGDKAPDADGAAALLAWLEKPAPDVLLIVHAGKLDARARASAWFGAFEREGVVVYAWPVDGAGLPGWIEARLRAAGLTADAESLDLLTARTEGNLLACAQEIEKLKLLCPDGRLTPARVLEATADSARFDAFDLVDKILLARPAAVLQVLDRLREEGVDAVPVIFVLAGTLRQLYRVGRAIESGTDADSALAAAKVFRARQPAFRQALRRLPPAKVLDFIKEASWVDRAAKGAAAADPWAELVKLAARLSGVPLPGARPA